MRNKLLAISCSASALGHRITFTRYSRGLKAYRNVSQTSRRRFERHMEKGKELEVIIMPHGLDITSYP